MFQHQNQRQSKRFPVQLQRFLRWVLRVTPRELLLTTELLAEATQTFEVTADAQHESHAAIKHGANSSGGVCWTLVQHMVFVLQLLEKNGIQLKQLK